MRCVEREHPMRSLRIVRNITGLTACIAAVVTVCMPASAWGTKGHNLVNHLAAVSLPTSVPAFMRTQVAVEELSDLGIELDLLKGAGTEWDSENDPGHYINLSVNDTIAGLPLQNLPATREAYDSALRARGSDQYKSGYLPYSILQGWEQLRMEFAYWRVDGYEAMHAKTTALRMKGATHRGIDETIILRDAGVWGHFVADASQPLHISVHFNGWGNYPNPNGYSNSKHIHDLFESTYVDRYITQPAVARFLLPLTVPRAGTLVSGAEAMRSIARYLSASNATVTELYKIEKAGEFEHATPEATSFVAARLAFGAGELRDLIAWAWEDSLNETIGDDLPQRVRDIVIGGATYQGLK
jgi:hypothetical protein